MPLPQNEHKTREKAEDVGYALAKGALSFAPFIGPLISELFPLLIPSPSDRRMVRWLEELTTGFEELKRKFSGFDLNKLVSNEAFKTILLNATLVAVRNHRKEKLGALRNAVLNSALSNAQEDEIEQSFITLIDTFTSFHLKALKFFDNPVEWESQHGTISGFNSQGEGSTDSPLLLQSIFPDALPERDFYFRVVNELWTARLIDFDPKPVVATKSAFRSHTTPVGKLFLKFIESPFALQ